MDEDEDEDGDGDEDEGMDLENQTNNLLIKLVLKEINK